MAWIRIIDENEAEGELKSLYEEIRQKRAKVANIMKIHSLLPRTIQAHSGLYLEIMFGRGGISREQREMIGIVVSRENRCEYCVRHHGEALLQYWKDPSRVAGFANDYRSARLSPADRAMIDYAAKLTSRASAVAEEDVNALRAFGLSDEQILHINLVTAYFNFVNRIVLGLGVEFTEEEVTGYKY